MFSYFSETSNSHSPAFANSSSLTLLCTSVGRIPHCPETLRGREPPCTAITLEFVGHCRFKPRCLLHLGLLQSQAFKFKNIKLLPCCVKLFTHPCTFWTENVIPRSHGLDSTSSLFLCFCLLGPLLSTSKESLLIVKIDFQLCLIYCRMLN